MLPSLLELRVACQICPKPNYHSDLAFIKAESSGLNMTTKNERKIYAFYMKNIVDKANSTAIANMTSAVQV